MFGNFRVEFDVGKGFGQDRIFLQGNARRDRRLDDLGADQASADGGDPGRAFLVLLQRDRDAGRAFFR